MSSNTKVTFDADSSKYLAEAKKREQAHEREIQQLQRQMKLNKEAANDEKKLRREVMAAVEAARTPAEAYYQTIEKYKKSLAAGIITEQQYNRVRDAALAKLNESKKSVDGQTDALKKLKEETRAASAADEQFVSMQTKAAAAALATLAAVTQLADRKRELRKENEGDVFSIDEASRSLATQRGYTTEAQRIAARDETLAAALENKVSPQTAFDSAKQLGGSGFSDDPRLLDFLLKLRAGANEKMSDPKALIAGMAQFLEASGQEKNFANFEDLGQRMRGLFANKDSSAVEVSDLTDFAKVAPAFKMAGVDTKTALSALAVVRGSFNSAETSTAMKSVMTALIGSGSTRSGEDALGTLKLKPNQVDMVGESLPIALRTLKAAVDAAPKEISNNAMIKLFGREQVPAAEVLLNNLDRLDKISESQIDREAFNAGARMNQSGRAADLRRSQTASAITAVKHEDEIATRAVVDEEVKRLRTDKVMGRKGFFGGAATLLEEGVSLPLLGNVSMNRADDVMAELNWISQEERIRRASQTTFTDALKSSYHGEHQWASEKQKQHAEAVVRGSSADPQMAEQNAILKKIEANVRPPIPAPAQNQQLRGRD